MSIDPRVALQSLTTAMEEHLIAASNRRGDGDPSDEDDEDEESDVDDDEDLEIVQE